jgi:hypothetical protein
LTMALCIWSNFNYKCRWPSWCCASNFATMITANWGVYTARIHNDSECQVVMFCSSVKKKRKNLSILRSEISHL